MALFSILVDIAAKTASFESGIKRVEDQLTDFGETVKKALEFAGISLGIKELIDQFDEFAEHAETMSHAAEKTGLAVDEISRLQFAATQSGVAADSLTSAVEKFSKAATESTTKAGEQRAAFAAIGVSVTDANGAIKPMEQLLEQVADRFESYRDSAEKTTLAQILFGKAGADLIPVLNLGSQGIQDLGKRSDELGNTISEKTAKQAEEFNSKLGEMKALSVGLWQAIASQLLPSLTSLTSEFTDASAGASHFQGIAEATATAVKLVASAALTIGGAFLTIGQFEAGIFAAGNAVAHGNFSEGFTIIKEAASDMKASLSGAVDSVTKLWTDAGDGIEDFGDKWDNNAKKVTAPIVSLYDASEQVLDALNSIDEKVRGTVTSNTDTITKAGESALTASLGRMHNTSVHFWDQLDEIGQSGAKSIQSSFETFLEQPSIKSFGNMLAAFGQTLTKMLAQATATDLFKALFGSDKEGNSGLGGILSGVLGAFFGGGGSGAGLGASAGSQANDVIAGINFGGGLASGGPLESGKWYVAGEHGPEPIWGGGGGAFAAGYGGGGAVINNNIDARGASFDLIKALPAILRQNNQQLEAKIVTGLQRNKY